MYLHIIWFFFKKKGLREAVCVYSFQNTLTSSLSDNLRKIGFKKKQKQFIYNYYRLNLLNEFHQRANKQWDKQNR